MRLMSTFLRGAARPALPVRPIWRYTPPTPPEEARGALETSYGQLDATLKDGTALTVRPLVQADIEALTQFVHDSPEAGRGALGASCTNGGPQEFSLDQLIRYYQGTRLDPSRRTIYGAFLPDSTLVGATSFNAGMNPVGSVSPADGSHRPATSQATLVVPSYQGLGVASALIAFKLEHAAAAGCTAYVSPAEDPRVLKAIATAAGQQGWPSVRTTLGTDQPREVEETAVDLRGPRGPLGGPPAEIIRVLDVRPPDVALQEAFFDAVESGEVARAEGLMKAGADVHAKTRHGRSALHLAAQSERGFRAIDFLIKTGVDVNARDGEGQTPLHEAVGNANTEAILRLAQSGADMNAKDRRGHTPWVGATRRRNIDLKTVYTLLDIGAGMNEPDLRAALITAVKNAQPDVVAALLAAGADPGAKDEDGKSALDWADALDTKRIHGWESCQALSDQLRAYITPQSPPADAAQNWAGVLQAVESKPDRPVGPAPAGSDPAAPASRGGPSP